IDCRSMEPSRCSKSGRTGMRCCDAVRDLRRRSMSTPSENDASARFAGSLSDGKAPTGVPATVSLTPDGLEITAAERARRRIWRYASLYSSAPLTARSRGVVLSESSLGTETLFVADPDFARALLAHATALGVVPRRVKALVPGVAATAAATVLAATVW